MKIIKLPLYTRRTSENLLAKKVRAKDMDFIAECLPYYEDVYDDINHAFKKKCIFLFDIEYGYKKYKELYKC